MKVLILGTGFAGEGHTDAFRSAGADVVGIVGRTPSVVSQVAEKLGISYHGTDWQAALEVSQPDIVSFNLERSIPFGWSHRKEDGGGAGRGW